MDTADKTAAKWKKAPHKDPLKQSASLIKGVWDILEALWKQWNDILHNGSEYAPSDSWNSYAVNIYSYVDATTTWLNFLQEMSSNGTESVRKPLWISWSTCTESYTWEELKTDLSCFHRITHLFPVIQKEDH